MRDMSRAYLLLQYPLLFYVFYEVVRACKRMRHMYPIIRSFERSMMDIAIAVAVAALMLLGMAMALYAVLGTNTEECSRVEMCMLHLWQAMVDPGQDGESITLGENLFDDSIVRSPFDQATAGSVYVLFPVLVTFVMLRFFAAIIVMHYEEESRRARAGDELRTAMRSKHDEAVDEAIEASYWPAAAAVRLALGLGWGSSRDTTSMLSGSDDMSDGLEMQFPSIVTESLRDLLGSIRRRAATNTQYSGDKRLDLILPYVNSPDDTTAEARRLLEVLNAKAAFIEDISDGVIDDTHENMGSDDTSDIHIQRSLAMWLRMNNGYFHEVQVKHHGSFGPIRVLDFISMLHARELERLDQMEPAKVESAGTSVLGRTLSRVASFPTSTSYRIHVNEGETPPSFKAPSTVSPADAYRSLLLESFDSSERKALAEKMAKNAGPLGELHSEADREALARIARRIVADIGKRSGTELYHEHGANLAATVLRRAHDNAVGIIGSLIFLKGTLSALFETLHVLRQLRARDVGTPRPSEDASLSSPLPPPHPPSSRRASSSFRRVLPPACALA